MKQQFIALFALFSVVISPTFAQELFVDKRDNKTYETIIVDGTIWMTGNLDYVTTLSLPSTPQQGLNPELEGRYYHIDEICCVCPEGWRLPGVEDWLSYFSYLLKSVDSLAPLKFLGEENHFAIDGYSEKLDLFSKDDPLKLTRTGRVEGGKYKIPENYADYWTLDPPEWRHDLPLTYRDHTHALGVVYDGKTHIHIRNKSFTNIHSHKHHLDPRRKKQLRMFMVRCVKSID